MRVGWFGGSFDPPHQGHVAVARAAADAFGLNVVLVAPTGRQPLKAGGAGASFADRLAMVELACGMDATLRASAADAPRVDGEANYTVDALASLRREWPGAEVFGILGMDAFLQMGGWHEAERARKMVEWIVATRPGYPVEGLEGVNLLPTVHVDISATGLRERLRAGEDCSEWVGGAVMLYIRERGLYCGDS